MDSNGSCDCDGLIPADDGSESVREIMARGYVVVLCIMALGFVIFVVGISVLAFFYPEKAGQFLTLYAFPVTALLGIYGVKAKNAYIAMLSGKKETLKLK